MGENQEVLQRLLENESDPSSALVSLSPSVLASVFISSSFLATVAEAFGFVDLEKKSLSVVRAIVGRTSEFAPSELQDFLKTTIEAMNELMLFFHSLEPSDRIFDISLHRTFDALDDVLGLDYRRDIGMWCDPDMKERLYEGAGLGVQTSYEAIMIALHKSGLKTGQTIIDLGSGYGRMGFIVGFLRPDLDFIGYEYVAHRVEVSNTAAQRAGLAAQVKFWTQDLSDPGFEIPIASAYYMFDPFTRETYDRVMARLKVLGRHRAIAVITKGRASDWVADALESEHWPAPERYDLGTLQVFRSER